MVDGVRSVAFAAAGERAGRVGYAARSSAGASKLGFQQAGCRAADVRHKLGSGSGSANLKRHFNVAALSACSAAAEHFTHGSPEASRHRTRGGSGDGIVYRCHKLEVQIVLRVHGTVADH